MVMTSLPCPFQWVVGAIDDLNDHPMALDGWEHVVCIAMAFLGEL